MNKNKINNLTLGADPEFFLHNIAKGRIEPAVGLIGGTKENGLFIPTGESVLEDNVMVEFTTTICKDAKELNDSIQRALTHLKNTLPQYYEFVFKASHVFEPADLSSEQAQEIGCEADYNAYTLRMNKPASAKNLMRTCSGHIHLGYDNPSIDTSLDLVMIMDVFLGIPSVLLDEDRDRRKMYGKAGCYRLKRYGVEYRVLSNFWVNKPELVEWVVTNINQGIKYYEENGIEAFDFKSVSKCINTYDTELAKAFIDKFNINMPESYVNTEWELIKEENKTVEAS